LADQGDEDLLLRPRPAVDVDEEERVTGKDVVRCVLVAIRPNAAAAESAASDQPGTGARSARLITLHASVADCPVVIYGVELA